MSIGEIIKQLRTSCEMTQQELADKLNISKQAVYKYETGIVTNIPSDKIEAMARIFGVLPQTIMGWSDQDGSDDLSKFGIRPALHKKIPMLGEIACGKPIFAEQNFDTYVDVAEDNKADFCLTCKGDSMSPLILNKDIVFIRKQDIVDNGQIAAVVINDEATLKRVFYDKPNNIVSLISENTAYPPMIYSGEALNDIHILGKAISICRKIK